jgi:hypothetical protein
MNPTAAHNGGDFSHNQRGNMGRSDTHAPAATGNYGQLVSRDEHQTLYQQVTHLQTTVHQITQGMATLTDTLRELKDTFTDFSQSRLPTLGPVRTEIPTQQPEYHGRKSRKREPAIEVSDSTWSSSIQLLTSPTETPPCHNAWTC